MTGPTPAAPGTLPPGWAPPVPPLPQPPKSARRGQVLMYACVAVMGLGIGAGISGGNACASGTEASPGPTVTVTASAAAAAPAGDPAPRVTVTETATVTAKPAPARVSATVPGDGTYLVGEDMKAGTWKTTGADGSNCCWERARDSSGELDSIIANDNIEGSGRVTVRKGETFKTSGCQEWVRVD